MEQIGAHARAFRVEGLNPEPACASALADNPAAHDCKQYRQPTAPNTITETALAPQTDRVLQPLGPKPQHPHSARPELLTGGRLP